MCVYPYYAPQSSGKYVNELVSHTKECQRERDEEAVSYIASGTIHLISRINIPHDIYSMDIFDPLRAFTPAASPMILEQLVATNSFPSKTNHRLVVVFLFHLLSRREEPKKIKRFSIEDGWTQREENKET